MKTKLTILIILLFSSTQFQAQSRGRDMNKERKIETLLEAIDPSLVKIFHAATIAMDQSQYQLSDSLYSIVYQKAPTFDPGLRRLGTVRLLSGKAQEGIDFCEKAVTINKTAYNYLSLAYCYTFAGTTQNFGKALILLKEAQLLPDGEDADILSLMGQIAIQEGNVADLRTVTSTMMNKFPDQMVTHYFAAIIADQDEEWTKAKDEILIAKKLGLSDDIVQKFLDSGVNSKVSKRQYGVYFLWILGIWIVGLLLLYLIGKLLSNFTLHSLEQQALTNTPVKTGWLRPIYRLLINIGGVYYYLSLPIILALVIALVVGLFYVFLLVGHIPIQLMLVLTVGSGFTIYSMIRSLLVKVNYTDPGRELNKEEAPGLFKLVNEVATDIGTRPVDEIRITPTTDLAVYERGSWKEKLQDKGKRILILGVGVLKEFKQNDCRAVLAHEYGHFSHRDTAGGDVALRVRNDMTKYFYALYLAGQNVWWNLAFHFLRLYNFIFRRISHGATRLQEILADRVAAQTYGVRAFKNGLTYVIKREIEFNTLANQEIAQAHEAKRSFHNLYELEGSSNSSMEDELSKALTRKTSEDDTHPSPVDRFRFIAGIDAGNIPENSSTVKELFLNWDSLTQEMTTLIESQIKKD